MCEHNMHGQSTKEKAKISKDINMKQKESNDNEIKDSGGSTMNKLYAVLFVF